MADHASHWICELLAATKNLAIEPVARALCRSVRVDSCLTLRYMFCTWRKHHWSCIGEFATSTVTGLALQTFFGVVGTEANTDFLDQAAAAAPDPSQVPPAAHILEQQLCLCHDHTVHRKMSYDRAEAWLKHTAAVGFRARFLCATWVAIWTRTTAPRRLATRRGACAFHPLDADMRDIWVGGAGDRLGGMLQAMWQIGC